MASVSGPAASTVAAAPASTAATAGLSKLAAAAGPVGIAIAAVATAATLAVVGIKMFGKTVEEEARKLALYSGAVAGARARSEIRELQATLRRTERIGPDVAKWEDMRGKFSEQTMNVQTELLNVALKFANEFEPLASAALVTLGLIAKGVEKSSPAIVATLTSLLGPLPTIANIAAKILGIKEEEKGLDGEGWDQFDKILPNRQAWKPPAKPLANNAARRPLAPNLP